MWRRYQRKPTFTDMRPYVPGQNLVGVSINPVDAANGSPRKGDMIARNPNNERDQWLVAEKYFADNFEQEPM